MKLSKRICKTWFKQLWSSVKRGVRGRESQEREAGHTSPKNQTATSSDEGPPKPPSQTPQNVGMRASPQRGPSNENLSSGSNHSNNANTGGQERGATVTDDEDEDNIPLARLISRRSSLSRGGSSQAGPSRDGASPNREVRLEQGKISVKVLFPCGNSLPMEMGDHKVDLTDLRIRRRRRIKGHRLKEYPDFVNFP
ncbi:unnamed protein product [Clonostachys rosea]|uniref:Uncharacterized protein n=1 Tax=Bionectria ochroleuca TaxID=29856 RepID=A0ABY6TTH2_BIOOC|nr:unnamed protein product [Clonostachys rosea]